MRFPWVVAALLTVFAAAVSGQQTSHYVGMPAGTAPAVVQGAPFSADLISSYDRAGDNGGHIRRETQGRTYRDAQGRTRTETEVQGPQVGSPKWERITINDPVRRQVIFLNPKTKTATVYHFGEGNGPTAPILAGNGDFLNQMPSKAPTQSVSTATKSGSIHLGNSVAPPPAVASGAVNGPPPVSGQDVVTRGHTATIHTAPIGSQTEALGTRKIAGVSATGTRTTTTVNSGTMDSGKPVVTITETWISPELKTTVFTSTDDGEGGHSVMKLVNITRSEPDPQLFQTPPDYTLKENVPGSAAGH